MMRNSEKQSPLFDDNYLGFGGKLLLRGVDMGQLPSIRVCSEQDKIGKSLYSEFSYKKTFPFLVEPKKIPLTDERIAPYLTEVQTSGICKASMGSGYFFSDPSRKELREKMGYQGNGPVYGGYSGFFGVQGKFPWEMPLSWQVPKSIPFGKGLLLSGAWSLAFAAPIEIFENYHAVKAGDRDLGEAIADGVTDVGIGLFAGTVGMTAGAKIGAALGTVMAPGLGTAAGYLAGGLIGYGLGYFLDEIKEQVIA